MIKNEDSEFSFTGIGTAWSLIVDGTSLSENAKKHVLALVSNFNERFSRFLDHSEVNAFREAHAGGYEVSEEFAVLLSRAAQVRSLTEGVYDPAVGGLLEQAGYDKSYSMTERSSVREFILPKWELNGRILTINGPVVFDLGGMGKGYCIDRVAGILENLGYRHYLVDGGGDMYGTSKAAGVPWEIALEYPGKPDIAAGIITLKNEGLAVSDVFRRRWQGWHHIVNPLSRTSVENVVGVAALAQSAWDADCTTSALFLTPETRYDEVAERFRSRYLVFRTDGTARASPDWDGELFT